MIRDLGIGQMSQNATGSSRCFGPPCALRMPPVDALQHIGELRRRDDNDAIGRRGPDELAALQPLSVQRHAQSIMPKHLQEVAPTPAEHKEIAGERICDASHIEECFSLAARSISSPPLTIGAATVS